MRISVTVAKAQLTEPARRAENGDEIVLTRHGHAAVRLVPVKAALDRESRRAILEAARAAGSAKAKAGPSAARSQDFLYGAPVIAVDTSALMAIVLGEPDAGACIAALEDEDEILISPGTLAEALIVSARRNVDAEVTSIIDRLGFAIVTATAAAARRSFFWGASSGRASNAAMPSRSTRATSGSRGGTRSARAAANLGTGRPAYRHVHRQHRAAPRHGRRPPSHGPCRDCAGGVHHAKQWRLDHVRQIFELTAFSHRRPTGSRRSLSTTCGAIGQNLTLGTGSEGPLIADFVEELA